MMGAQITPRENFHSKHSFSSCCTGGFLHFVVRSLCWEKKKRITGKIRSSDRDKQTSGWLTGSMGDSIVCTYTTTAVDSLSSLNHFGCYCFAIPTFMLLKPLLYQMGARFCKCSTSICIYHISLLSLSIFSSTGYTRVCVHTVLQHKIRVCCKYV